MGFSAETDAEDECIDYRKIIESNWFEALTCHGHAARDSRRGNTDKYKLHPDSPVRLTLQISPPVRWCWL